jgi:hypothetical protein
MSVTFNISFIKSCLFYNSPFYDPEKIFLFEPFDSPLELAKESMLTLFTLSLPEAVLLKDPAFSLSNAEGVTIP